MVRDGKVGAAAIRFEGPVGIRSDNAKLQFRPAGERFTVAFPPPLQQTGDSARGRIF